MEKATELVSRLKLYNLVKNGIVFCAECHKQVRDGDDKEVGGIYLRHANPCHVNWKRRAIERLRMRGGDSKMVN